MSRGSASSDERPSSTTVTALVGPAAAGSAWWACSGGVSSTKNSSVCTRSAGTPAAASTSRAPTTMSYGPHSHHWSTSAGRTTADSSARSLARSSRLLCSSTCRASRDSTCTSSKRSVCASFRSASSSTNITVSLRRFPYSSVALPPPASTACAIDSTGVIPEPAATSACQPSTSDGVKLPLGGATSISSPGRTWWTSQRENTPPGTSRTPMRGVVPGGAQIEYDRRSSRPFIMRRRVSDCPGRNAYSAASSGGTAKPTATASSHSRCTSDTRSGWNAGRRRVGGATSVPVTA